MARFWAYSSVYDNESSLYYLQSRYYDPQLGRFINADAFASTGQGLLGNNMFAYCLNNPIIHLDPSGLLAVGSTVALSDMRADIASNIAFGPSLEGMLGPYDELRKITAGRSEYEVHHLVEKRFYQVPGIGKYKNNPNSAPSVILCKDTHKGYTSRARGEFKYGTNYTKVNATDVKNYYMHEYGGRKDWLELIVGCFE